MTVLVLDDDDVFRTALSELLADDGHAVLAFRSIAELPPLDELADPAALITDYQLGTGEDGLGFAARFNAAHPDVPVILVTAYASDYVTDTAAALPYMTLLRKPLQYEELHRLLHAARIPSSEA
jgi:DNA-binding NtrC family response regulator